MSAQESKELSTQVRDLLWHGNVNEIVNLVRKKLARKKNASKTALKKLNDYLGEHSRFQYATFREKGLPTGSGTFESVIRRVINLRIKENRIVLEA